jgi:hypothetical protein
MFAVAASAQATLPHGPGTATLPDDESTVVVPAIAGTWKSVTPATVRLMPLQRSAWGSDAAATRTTEIVVHPSGTGTLTMTTTVIDGRGRVVRTAGAVHQAQLVVERPRRAGQCEEQNATVVAAERRYLSDPRARWTIDGLRVMLTTCDASPDRLEVRLEIPGATAVHDVLRRTA